MKSLEIMHSNTKSAGMDIKIFIMKAEQTDYIESFASMEVAKNVVKNS